METTKPLRISSLENDRVCCHIVAVPVGPVEVGNECKVVGGGGISSGKGVASGVEGGSEMDDSVKDKDGEG